MSARATVLLVEDDANLGFVIKDNLEMSGFRVVLCEDGEKGWDQFRHNTFDICILDVMLPKKDGFTLAEAIRRQNDWVPILFLTAKSMKEDKIKGFRAGADDYITKPFSIEELVLRIEVFLKRTRNVSVPGSSVAIGQYEFNYRNLTLTRLGQVVQLTQKEADILRLFCQNQDKILKREEILTSIWGDDDYFMGRSLDVFISKLRKYLKDDSRIAIENIHGVGFKITIKD